MCRLVLLENTEICILVAAKCATVSNFGVLVFL